MNFQKGFSLFEIILAVAVFAVLVVGISTTVLNSTSEFKGQQDDAVKERFANEAKEATLALRDTSWASLTSLATSSDSEITGYDLRKGSSGGWEFFLGTTTRAALSRNIFIYDVERDGSNNIVSSGGTWDPTTKRFVVKIIGGTSEYQLDWYVSSWKSYTINQTDWSGSTGVEVWSGNSLSNDMYSAANIGGSTAGQLSVAQESSWYDSAWLYRKSITISSAFVPSTQTNFPVLVSITDDSDLAANVAQADGGDIVFTDSNNTKLDFEIEQFDAVAGTINAWVEVPSLSGSADTTLYMYYGNSIGGLAEWDVNGTWDEGGNANYKLIQHFNETSGTLYDSTSNANDCTAGTGANPNYPGRISSSTDFLDSASTAELDCGTGASLAITGDMTVSFWIYPDNLEDWDMFIGRTDPDNWDDGWGFTHWLGAGNDFRFFTDSYNTDAQGTITAGQWTHVVGVHDDTTGDTLYINGTLVQSASQTTALSYDASYHLWIGSSGDATTYYNMNGRMDEVRISNTLRSADWVTTEHNNMSATSTFYLVGEETDEAGAGGGAYLDTGYATSSAAVISYSTSPDIINRNPLTLRWTQQVPSGCSLQIYIEGTNTLDGSDPDWNYASLVGPFSVGGTAMTTSTVDLTQFGSISDKKWLRYGVRMDSCTSNTESPTLFDINIEVD